VLKHKARVKYVLIAFENKEKRGTYRTEREKGEDDENYTTRRFIKCALNEMLLHDQGDEVEKG
jgi:hypothetical protein